MSRLEEVITAGNRYWRPPVRPDSTIRCADGFTCSVIAGQGAYCAPYVQLDTDLYRGPYDEVEVGFPTARPEPWDRWAEWAEDPDDPTGTVYAFVPVDMVRDLIAAHGGEA